MDELKAFFHASLLQLSSSAFGDSREAPTAGVFQNRTFLESIFQFIIVTLIFKIVFATEDEIKKSKDKMKKIWEEFLEIVRAQVRVCY